MQVPTATAQPAAVQPTTQINNQINNQTNAVNQLNDLKQFLDEQYEKIRNEMETRFNDKF